MAASEGSSKINWKSFKDVESAVDDHIKACSKAIQTANSNNERWQVFTESGGKYERERMNLKHGLSEKWMDTKLPLESREDFYALKLRLSYVQKNLVHIVNQEPTVMEVVNGNLKHFKSLLKPRLPSMGWQDLYLPFVEDSPMRPYFEATLIFVLTHADHALSTSVADKANLAVQKRKLRTAKDRRPSSEQLVLVDRIVTWATEVVKGSRNAHRTIEEYSNAMLQTPGVQAAAAARQAQEQALAQTGQASASVQQASGSSAAEEPGADQQSRKRGRITSSNSPDPNPSDKGKEVDRGSPDRGSAARRGRGRGRGRGK